MPELRLEERPLLRPLDLLPLLRPLALFVVRLLELFVVRPLRLWPLLRLPEPPRVGLRRCFWLPPLRPRRGLSSESSSDSSSSPSSSEL